MNMNMNMFQSLNLVLNLTKQYPSQINCYYIEHTEYLVE